MKPNLSQTVGEIAIAHPAAIRVFESLGIDYCCGGARTLKDACDHAGVPAVIALESLESANDGPVDTDGGNLAEASCQELIRHIVSRHHHYVRGETPRLLEMLGKVLDAHRETHPELVSLRDLFTALAQDLAAHMMKEENVLFPYLERMELAVSQGAAPPPAMFGSVEMPISRMLADHEDAGEVLSRMRALSSGYHAPDSACPTYRGLYVGLEEFERDLHRHIHLENNILFPRALRMEQESSTAVQERR